jgi:hypothetical protein
MAVTANSIVTPQLPRAQTAICTTANTTYTDTPTNTAALWTAGENGSRITKLYAIPRATVTLTQLQVYRAPDGVGTIKYLFASKAMAAYTMAATTEVPTTDFGYSEDNPLILDGGEILYVAIGVTGAIAFHAEGSDY